MIQQIKNWFKRLHNFCLCFLQDDCEYSIKKLLAFVFSALAIWMVLSQHLEQLVEVLGFIAILLGLRAWERTKLNNKTSGEQQNDVNINKG